MLSITDALLTRFEHEDDDFDPELVDPNDPVEYLTAIEDEYRENYHGIPSIFE